MELDLEKIEVTQQNFNKKYGVNFRISEFDGQLRALEDNFVSGGTPKEDWNALYKSDFIKLMKRAFVKFVDNKIEEFDPKKMLDDFEEMIMGPYREECGRKNATGPEKNANWSDKAFYERVKREFEDIPNSKRTYAENRYMKGTLRVRDIRAFRRQFEAETARPSAKELSTLITYKCALENAVNSRTRGFYFRHPFKSWAEYSELKVIKGFIAQKITGSDTSENVEQTEAYIEAESIMNDKTIENLKDNVTKEIEKSDTLSSEKTKVFSDSLNVDDQHTLSKGFSEPIHQTVNDKTIENPSRINL